MVALAAALPLLGACAGPSQLARMQETQGNLRQFLAATQDAVECRAAAARNPRYHILELRMPLMSIGAASLPQMVDPKLATNDEISALEAWTSDVDACQERLLQEADRTLAAFGPIIEAARDEDDVAFVKLSLHQMTWGQAVMRLKANSTKLRGDLINRADQVAAELDKLQQEQLNRRATILSSVIRILP